MLTTSFVGRKTAFHVRNPWQLGVNFLVHDSHNRPTQLRTSEILGVYSCKLLCIPIHLDQQWREVSNRWIVGMDEKVCISPGYMGWTTHAAFTHIRVLSCDQRPPPDRTLISLGEENGFEPFSAWAMDCLRSNFNAAKKRQLLNLRELASSLVLPLRVRENSEKDLLQTWWSAIITPGIPSWKKYFLFLPWRQKRSTDGNCTFRSQFGIFANNLGEKKPLQWKG